MAELAQHAAVVGLFTQRSDVEIVLHRVVHHVGGQTGWARIDLVLLRIIDLHRIAAAIGDLFVLFSLGQRPVEHLLAVEDRQSRLNVVEEPFVMVVADNYQRIRIDLGDALGDHVELFLATVVTLLANLQRILPFKMIGFAQVVELSEIERSGSERERLVLTVHVGAQIPFVRRGCQ